MTEEQIMEQLSRGYLSLVGARRGYKPMTPTPDSGVDLVFCPAVPRERNGRTRWLDSDKKIDIQLKSAHRRRAPLSNGLVTYDLDAPAYNDLVERRDGLVPLYLVLLVLPDEPEDWLGVSAAELVVRECAYWWQPEEAASLTENTDSKRIKIPEAQRVTLDFMPERFVDSYGAER